MYFTVFEENICWSIYLLRVVWFCLLHVSSVVTAFSKGQGNLIRNGCPEGICDCNSSWAYTWICDGTVTDASVYGAAGNRNKLCTYLINSLTICYNIFFYLIHILSWYKFIASSANEALRVEFSTSSNFTWGSAQTKDTGFWGEFTASSTWGAPHKPGELIFREVYIKLYVWAPRKLRDKPNPSSHGHGCCVSGSGPRAY